MIWQLRKRHLSKNFLLLALLSLLIYTGLTLKSGHEETNLIRTAVVTGQRSESYSPFYRTLAGRAFGDLFVRNPFDLAQWHNWSLQEKCHFYFDTTYRINSEWSNDMVRYYFGNPGLDNAVVSLLGERMRMYRDCFIDAALDLTKVLADRDVTDFDHRMFPFLKRATDVRDLRPQVTHLNSGAEVDFCQNFAASENQASFWSSWAACSSGSGIALTLGQRHVNLFGKLLRVLQHLGNTLPIQIVQKGAELSTDTIDQISQLAVSSGQQVYLVDCAPILADNYQTSDINAFVNKWLAATFNTFEEVVLLDADVVPFLEPSEFLAEPNYRRTGAAFYKDRTILSEHTFPYCIEMFDGLEPSLEEKYLMNHTTKINKETVPRGKLNVESEEERLFQRFTYDIVLHGVDSGLVVLKKRDKMATLLLSFLMNLDKKVQRCVYGDKELFWLAQIYMGEDFVLYPTAGCAIGEIEKKKLENGQEEYRICSTQMAHSENGRLLWTNGGLATCKIRKAAEQDFETSPEYFRTHYHDIKTLDDIYSRPLIINGIIVPDVFERPWTQKEECKRYTYCASALKRPDGIFSPNAEVELLDGVVLKELNSISHLWNSEP
ncbi:LAMI_0E06106g1_1 [Lachancea mirantina]|uniref:LAMI_0E06106g1_1 n=1 Tax=Lachancea mirantina TaxID=1230905 RepID=A0A1G4JLJ6_9SACH|nr:LAMI_0E06106g1_1 [Lachancea mirantina]